MSTLQDKWNQLVKNGFGFSFLKDGKPDTTFSKILGFGYAIVLMFLLIVNVLLLKITWNKFGWKSLIATILIGTAVGEVFGIIFNLLDANCPAWIFHPWTTISMKFWLQTPEDWLFYPICGTLFILIMILIPIERNDYYILKTIILCLNVFVSTISAIVYQWGVWWQLILFAVPGLVMYVYAWENMHPIHYTKCAIIFCAFAWVWDYLSVVYFHGKSGLAWFQLWTYISRDAVGNYIHSSLFLDYNTHKWSWLWGELPTEITPLFAIFGTMFIYPLYASCNKFFNNK